MLVLRIVYLAIFPSSGVNRMTAPGWIGQKITRLAGCMYNNSKCELLTAHIESFNQTYPYYVCRPSPSWLHRANKKTTTALEFCYMYKQLLIIIIQTQIQINKETTITIKLFLLMCRFLYFNSF